MQENPKKKWHQSKTVWVNVIIVACAGLDALINQGNLTKDNAELLTTVVGVLNILLRLVSNKKVTK